MSEPGHEGGNPLVIGIGEILWDLLPGGRVLGGAPVNFACHASRLGVNAAAVSAVGGDNLGEDAVDRLRSSGVDVGGIAILHDRATGTVDVTIAAGGEPTYRITYPAAWDFLPFTATSRALVASADAICYGTLAQRGPVSGASIRALIDATEPRCLRVFDVNLREPWIQKDVITDLLERSNVLKLNGSELVQLAEMLCLDGSEGERLEDLAERYRLHLVALTKGGSGCHLFAGGRHALHGGFPVSTLVDTVGAGDAFTAAMVLGILRDMPLAAVAEWRQQGCDRGLRPVRSLACEHRDDWWSLMNSFRYFQPTELRFGRGRLDEVGELVRKSGDRCLLVTTSRVSSRLTPVYERVDRLLEAAGVAVAHFDGVHPNPTTDLINAGARIAREHGANVVLGVGGGSAMDAAKAIAVEATHSGTAWDYLFFKQQPDARTLPIVVVSTTSGTGSQVTQVSVLTNAAERDKSAIYNEAIFPRAAIIDSDLMLSAPPRVTAATGFDAFAHSFESYLHPNASPYTDLMALEAIRLVVRWLPAALKNGSDAEARERLAWADTLAGLCITAAGVTLPHGISMAMGGLFPQVAHGEALAVVYPAVLRFSTGHAVDRFAALARTIDDSLRDATDTVAAAECGRLVETFLGEIDLRLTLDNVGVPTDGLAQLAKQSLVLPDFRNHPRIATEAEVLELLQQCS